MIRIGSQMSRISSFRELDISKIECVSFYYEDGYSYVLSTEQIGLKKIHSISQMPFIFAFVNFIGGGYAMLYKNK